ncbi:unnamed protein product [Trichobilharzia regenti]|uniref:Usp domain-containing protein n=1 Tax=Trichobilharzia regenti TaxID=157069 RepID=A0A183WUS6_TRIRE|nr:unnamed protein product [Trichobilharzia regenti]VDQ11758.1 unnamed protein product [Trichobilharzia regenti]
MSEVNETPRVVLMPIDGSEHAQRAFQWYIENMKRPNDIVKFINIVEPVYATPAVGLTMETPPLTDITKMMQDSIDNGKVLGKKYITEAKQCGVNCQAFLHVDTRPGAALLKSIEDHNANVIIMGNRGLGAIRRTFLGSVSEYVLHHAHIPVIIVPPKEKH